MTIPHSGKCLAHFARSHRAIGAMLAVLLALTLFGRASAQQTSLQPLRQLQTVPSSTNANRKQPVTLQRADSAAKVQPRALSNVQLKPRLTVPSNLGMVHDTKICAGHAGKLFQGPSCASLGDGSNVAMLSWSWAPCSTAICTKNITGFRIYHSGSKTTAWIGNGTIHAVNAQRVASVPRSQTAFGITSFKPGDCFTVRAYTAAVGGRAAQESADSDQFCLQRGMRIGTRKVVLTPKYAKNTSGSNEKPDKAFGCHGQDHFVIDPDNSILPIDTGDTLPSELVVGNHQRLALSRLHDEYACDHRMVTFHRAAVFFDLTGLATPLSAATLSFEIHQSALRLGSPGAETRGDLHTYPFSCAASVGYATDNWLQAWDQRLINGNGFVSVPSYRQRVSTPLTVSVSPIVGVWLKGSTPNRGFVLKMADNDEHEQSQNSVCMTAYDHFKLTIVVPRTL